jgi:hypothetical protein
MDPMTSMGGAFPGASPDPMASVPGMSLDTANTTNGKVMDRDTPEVDESRAALVTQWADKVKAAKAHWEPSFKRMREDQDFAIGLQWSKDRADPRYLANITLRMVAQKTAFLYAKNPRAVAKRREKINHTVWDGTQAQLQQMQQGMQMAMQTGMAQTDPNMQQAMMQAGDVLMDAKKVHDEDQQLDLIAKTLELLYDYNVSEQLHPFKQMMKMVVRRTITTGVGYVKIGFQRVMDRRPEIEAKIADISQRLSTLERLSADLADGEIDEMSAEAEQLRLTVKSLSEQVEFVVREGLTFDYPASTGIIPAVNTVHLREFLGADWVAQEYALTPDEVKEIYQVDVGSSFTAYTKVGDRTFGGTGGTATSAAERLRNSSSESKDGRCTVWEIYSRKDGLVYHVCDGYPQFLREPAAPETVIERFYPWFALAFNECEHEDEIFPPSDVRLMKDMQLEYNRARQGLREHRIAARPKTIVSAGMLDAGDIAKLADHPANAVIEVNGLQPGQDVKTVLQPFTGPGLDPNLYEINPIYEDVMRTTGVQEANLGGTSSGTATESNIAEASRQTSMGSNIDDLDDLLSQLAHAGGQILLKEVSADTAKKIVGEGALWPEMSRQEIAEDLWLEVEAGSTGRPNQAQEIANVERLMPLLLQIPGLDPEALATEILRRLDDKMDIKSMFKPMQPSITMMNSMAPQPTAPGAGQQPGQAGGPAGAASSGAPVGPGQGGSPPPDQVQSMGGGLPN